VSLKIRTKLKNDARLWAKLVSVETLAWLILEVMPRRGPSGPMAVRTVKNETGITVSRRPVGTLSVPSGEEEKL
jgi:hypothetical protein